MSGQPGNRDDVQRTMSALTLLVSVVILTLGFMMYDRMKGSSDRITFPATTVDGVTIPSVEIGRRGDETDAQWSIRAARAAREVEENIRKDR